MKVKVRNQIYDGENEPIMLIFTYKERQQIAAMPPEATKYCIFPAIKKWIANDYKKIKEWMNT